MYLFPIFPYNLICTRAMWCQSIQYFERNQRPIPDRT